MAHLLLRSFRASPPLLGGPHGEGAALPPAAGDEMTLILAPIDLLPDRPRVQQVVAERRQYLRL